MREARWWEPSSTGGARCLLCPHGCTMAEGQDGLCGVRGVREGALRALGYGVLSAAQVDPVEKKPLTRFMTGTRTYSVGSYGCNMRCPFCQNHGIAWAALPEGAQVVTPEEVVAACEKSGCPSLSFTYNEPLISYEFVLDTAKLIKSRGLAVILVTNGQIDEEPLGELMPFVDAMNVDVKSSRPEVYREALRGDLSAALRTVRLAAAHGVHVEVTALMVPGICEAADVEAIARFIAAWGDIPLHVTRYFPRWRYDAPATDTGEMRAAADLARQHLSHVYLGNV